MNITEIYDPQENYSKITHDMLKILCRTRIPGEPRQVLDTILRKTYGWKKYEDAIPLEQFSIETGIEKAHVIRALDVLKRMNIITAQKIKLSLPKKVIWTTTYRINNDYDSWIKLPKKKNNNIVAKEGNESLPKKAMAVAKEGNESLPNWVPQKKIQKKIQKTLSKERLLPSVSRMRAIPNKTAQEVCVPSFSDFLKTANDFCEGVQRLAPKRKPENLNDAAKILSEIGGTPDEISQVILFAQNHDFWKSRTLSAENFAASYDKMRLQMPVQDKFVSERSYPLLFKHEDYVNPPIIQYGDNSIFANPDDTPKTTGYQVNVDEAYLKISESKTLYDLLILWAIHPPWGKYDILKEKKRHMSYALSQDVIDGSQSMEELVEVFRPSEMQAFMRECPPEIIKKYYEKLHSFDCPKVAADSFDQEDLTGNSMASGF